MADQTTELRTYRGNCHCKAHVFEIKLPELKTVVRCNCSVCYKKGTLWAFPEPGNFSFVKGDENSLQTYTFGKRLFTQKFCPTCGTSLLCIGNFDPEHEAEYGVNVRALQDVDIWSLETRLFDAASKPPAYEAPVFTGAEPEAVLEGSQIVTGSCHCGAIRVALKTRPLDDRYDGDAYECNCSICRRYGQIGIYPKNEHIAIQGEENLTFYKMGFGLFAKQFCRTCGIFMFNRAAEIPEQMKAHLPEQALQWYERGRVNTGLNAKTLNAVDLKSLKVTRVDGWNNIKPLYVNP